MALCHVTLATRDIDGTREFFATALGWRPIYRPSNIPMRAAWLEVAPGQEIHLIEVADYEPSPFEREYGRHMAVAFPHREFPALKERLTRLGAEIIDADRPTPFERFFFRDPNGYVIEVVEAERRPETE
jgi:catechol 2,3-dioxygenase-like lactoylglutathione lyase family enzyme